MPHPVARLRIPAWALAALLCACGGSEARLEAARYELSRGRLDQALALLEDARGAEATGLRAEVDARRAQRVEVEEVLERLRAGRGDRPGPELMAELAALLEGERDPVVRERIDRERSTTADWVAERDAARPFRHIYLPGLGLDPGEDESRAPGPAGPAPVRPGVDDPLLERILEDVRAAEAARSWQQGIAMIDMVVADAPEHLGAVSDLRRRLVRSAELDAQDLLRAAQGREEDRGVEAALGLLAAELWRFPDQGGAAAVQRAFEDLRRRRAALAQATVARVAAVGAAPLADAGSPADGPAAGEAAAPSVSPVFLREPPADDGATALAQGSSAIELAVAAVKAAREDSLEEARELWLAAAERASTEGERARHELAAFGAEGRLALRAALVAAEAVAADVDWKSLPGERIAELARRVELDPPARVGLALEKLVHGLAQGPEGGLADLSRALKRGWLDQRRCWELVASWRGEPLPPGGYAFRRGVWVSALELERGRLGKRVESLSQRLASTHGEEREEAYRELAGLGRESVLAAEALRAALVERWDAAARRVVRSRTLDELGTIADKRSELDVLRRRTLELIFDTDVYFYPYDPPANPSKTTADYWAVQREIERRVDALRELWEDEQRVRLPELFREALEDLAWVRARGSSVAARLALPREWPSWLGGIDPRLETITVASFASTASEAENLARDRWLIRLNEGRWQRAQQSGVAPTSGERELVRLTNAYRRMMGFRALAWDGRIQAAARGHSDYMLTTGRFGHYEIGSEGRETPHERMRLAGYPKGTGENVHVGTSDPEQVQRAWLMSSAHHRNLLVPTHREMACAGVDHYWTQNFGTGTDFESELDEWRD